MLLCTSASILGFKSPPSFTRFLPLNSEAMPCSFLQLVTPSICLLSLLVFGAPVEHLVAELPGQPPVGFRQYSGYINVDPAAGTNLFYYFVEADVNASSSLPLALWLNGGPGCSSVGGGAFTELGPFYPDHQGRGLRRNPYSWNKVANILFLESPAGVGWSYSVASQNAYAYNDSKVAEESLVFMRMWFERFPKYRGRQLFLTGESYAGHYIPQLASLMLMHPEFNLSGILIGNPLLNYGIDTSATYAFLWSHGVISDATYRGVSRWCNFSYGYLGGKELQQEKNGKSTLKSSLSELAPKPKGGCTSFLGTAKEEMGSYINIYDVTSSVCPPPIHAQAFLLHKLMGLAGDEERSDVCVDDEITRYLNQPAVQRALHANLTYLSYPWQACSRIVKYSEVDQLMDMTPLLSKLIQNRLPIWIFSGDQDSVVPLTGTRSQLSKLAQRLNISPKGLYRPWYSNGQVGGWFESYGGDGRLVYATVRGASHMVPYAQPERALVLFSSFSRGRSLPSHP